jgi:diguanylate cyclase (GGDEF)-like protein
MLDLDGLKFVNDTYGHSAGDFYITQFAERLKRESEENGIVARLGGDEFALFFGMVESIDSVSQKVHEIVEKTEGELHFESTKLNIRASAGVAIFPDDGTELEALMVVADTRLYENKRKRKESKF